MEIVKITEELAYSDQPSFKELRAVNNRWGFRTIVNVRLDAEQTHPEEEDAARTGLEYFHLPIAQRHWGDAPFDDLFQLLKQGRKTPVLVHSAEGARAGILALTCHAALSGWTEQRLSQQGRTLGLDIPEEALGWLHQHSTAYDDEHRASP